MNSVRAVILCSLILSAGPAFAEVKPMELFSDGMILQREAPVPVWGTADPGEQVTVSFGAQQKSELADAGGKWKVTLDPLPADATPATMTISGGNSSVTINDVLVGDVWLASGQSNMDFMLGNTDTAGEELPKAGDKQLRFFQIAEQTSGKPEETIPGAKWVASTPETAKKFSAVAYFFAKEIRKKQECPVGIIQASWGGTKIQVWMGLDAFKKPTPLAGDLGDWKWAVAQHEKVQAEPKLAADYQEAMAAWKKEKEGGGKGTQQAEPQNPDPMGMPAPSKRPQTPSVVFNAMIHPVIPYALRGALWYQGENNGSQGLQYREWLPRLISDWRTRWGFEFPFLIVQLPCFGKDDAPVSEKGWPWLREAQLRTLSVPKTGMAVAIDVGDPNNVHPPNKVHVGKRLALLARRDVYGEDIVASGPLYDGFKIEGDKIRITFKETAKGLTPGRAPWAPRSVEPLPTDRLVGFYIAGSDKKWVEAEATIEGNDVIVSNSTVSNPAAVRYGWAQSPRCNLYNSEGLPASPFRTDSWDSQ